MRNPNPTALLLATAAISLLGCPPRAAAELVDLSDSLEAFSEHFDEAAGFPRFVAVLSPT